MFQFINFIRKKVAEYSNSNGQRGTIVDEMAVKPTGLVLTDFNNSLVKQQTINDISNWESMTEEDMDFFGNKFFINREDGDYAVGVVRIIFTAKFDFPVTSEFTAVSNSDLLYNAIAPSQISRNAFRETGETPTSYYVDIPIKASQKGDEYNSDPNTITAITGISFEYARVFNVESISNGALHETNEQYVERLESGINDRSMMNKRSVFSGLKKFFPFINSIHIAGPGDKYMLRDLVQSIDLSSPPRQAEFLGKITGSNMINHSAYYGVFPPEAGTRPASFSGPFSIYSDYMYPLSIDATDLLASDPAFHGYPLDQEATSEMYQGLYFDDYQKFMQITTADLFNIQDEGIGLEDVATPNVDWYIAANNRKNGDYGRLEEVADLSQVDIISFNDNAITLKGGSYETVTAEKDISKRIGIKLTGTFNMADDANDSVLGTSLQFMLGGINPEINSGFVDSFTGIGFGIRIHEALNTGDESIMNASVFFAHSEKYGSSQIFAASNDFEGAAGHVSISGLNALAERETRIESTKEYEFEYIIYDDLSMSLYIKKTSPDSVNDPNDIFENWLLPKNALSVFSQQLLDVNSDHYGTMMKVTLQGESLDNTDVWVVNDLKAFDLANHRANAMFIFDIKDVEAPLAIEYRGSGQSSIDGENRSGYGVYIWDTEQSSAGLDENILTQGGWSLLEGVSNQNGEKDEVASNLTHDLNSVDQYKIASRFGDIIILLVTTTGPTKPNFRVTGSSQEDIQSDLIIDYIRVRSQLVDVYHSNNKTDIFVNTISNSDTLESDTQTIIKGSDESYFPINTVNEFKMPIASIEAVSIGEPSDGNSPIGESEYQIIRDDLHNLNSVNETVKLVLENEGIDQITIEYTFYKSVAQIQDFYDSSQYGKILGNVLAKHKYPCLLDIPILYTGSGEEEDVVAAVRTFTDENIDSAFNIRNMINYLFQEGIVNNVQEPLTITYSKFDDELNTESGTFTDELAIRPIDFFRINNITASRI